VTVSREQKMVETLQELKAESQGVQGVVLISSDAMALASEMNESVSEEVLSALSSSLVATSEKVAGELACGEVEQVYLRGVNGDLLVVRVNKDALLACTVDSQAKMGLTLMEVSKCALKLADII
jgi:uncharacterized protein